MVFRAAIFFILCCTCRLNVFAQDSSYARNIVNHLCKPKFHGRGYYKNGAVKAADFIEEEMKKAGLKPVYSNGNYFQEFNLSVNVFSQTKLTVNGKKLIAGKDFIVHPASQTSSFSLKTSCRGLVPNEKIKLLNQLNIRDSNYLNYIMKIARESEPYEYIFIIDTLPDNIKKEFKKELDFIRNNCASFTFTTAKFIWGIADLFSATGFEIQSQAINPSIMPCADIRWKVKSESKTLMQKNVMGYVRGTKNPDKVLLVSAHYDHLGQMGKTAIFPGANDNACGVAMLLDMARYYVKNPPDYSIIFIAFAGEEAGLIGSRFFIDNPPLPLKKIRFVMNLDLVGTGENGGTVVNGSVYKNEFKWLDSINRQNKYLPRILTRGKAANSDHYFFSENGIPAFFLYLAGPRPAYHDIYDVPETLTMAGYNSTFRLIRDFFKVLATK